MSKCGWTLFMGFMFPVEVLVVGVAAVICWLPLLIAHSAYLHRNVEGHLILGERRLVHRLVLVPILRFLSGSTFLIGQFLIWSDSGDHWLGMTAAFRILSVIIDRFVFYGLFALAWKSWKCARAGFSRNESRAILSLVMFAGVSDLIWIATEATGQSAMHTIIFRTTFYLYFVIGCKLQGQAIGRRVKALENLSVDPVSNGPISSATTSEVTVKLEKFQVQLRAHTILYWFGLCFATYNVAYLIAVTQKMVPEFLPIALWEELSYLLLYGFLATCILKNLIY